MNWFFFLFFLVSWPWYCSVVAIPFTELTLLFQLYLQTNGPNWNWRAAVPFGPRWNFEVANPNPCNTKGVTWQGISCSLPPQNCTNATSPLCQILRIDLDLHEMRGPLLSNWTDFSRLIGLSFNANNLTGPIPWLYPPTLGALWFSRNQFSGTIPPELALLSSLAIIHFEGNSLKGTIPSAVGDLSSLRSLYFSMNQLTGTIPSSLCQLSDLLVLYLYSNCLTGQIPSEISSLSSLSFLVIDDNSLSGLLPPSLGLLSSLIFLDLDLNYFTGPLPPSITSLTKVETFSLDGNLLSSSLPCDLNRLVSLTYLDVDYNYFTGLCSSLTFPATIEVLDLSWNLFLSPLSPSLIANLSQLQLVDLEDNFFTGPLPSNLHVLTALYYLGVGRNSLTGPLPNSISELTFLEQLYLEDNALTGSLEPLFHYSSSSLSSLTSLPLTASSSLSSPLSSIFSTPPMNLNSLDLSNNQFTGTLLSELFTSLPKIRILALTSNCFHGQLPHSICTAHELAVLSLDGLGAGHGCSFKDSILINQLAYRNSISGDIPSCLWTMTNLTILSLAGNALTGTLHSLPPLSSLINLTLSHNHLSGSIPHSLFAHNFQSLDLSYNKFNGEYSFPTNHSHLQDRRVILEVNRLSGEVPSDRVVFDDFNILTGNIFSCHQLPSQDQHADTYRCGSEIFDYAMVMFAALFGVLVLGLLFAYLVTQRDLPAPSSASPSSTAAGWLTHLSASLALLSKYLSPASHLNDFMSRVLNCPDILKSLTVFIYLQETVRYVFFASLLATLPLYLLRFIDGKSSTHTHLYRWVWTTAYFSGPVPASLLLGAWILVVSVFFFRLRRLKGEGVPSPSLDSRPVSSGAHITSTTSLAPLSPLLFHGTRLFGSSFPTLLMIAETTLMVSLNIAVMGTANALYIIASNHRDISSKELFIIQFSFAVFKVVWSKLCLPQLDFSKRSQRAKLFVLALNSVFIPSIAIALTSPTCFQVSFLHRSS
jgi:hypothetical protein